MNSDDANAALLELLSLLQERRDTFAWVLRRCAYAQALGQMWRLCTVPLVMVTILRELETEKTKGVHARFMENHDCKCTQHLRECYFGSTWVREHSNTPTIEQLARAR